MEIRYSKHLLIRIEMRGIPHRLPRIVYERARRRFRDTESDLEVAVLKAIYFGRERDIAVTYAIYPNRKLPCGRDRRALEIEKSKLMRILLSPLILDVIDYDLFASSATHCRNVIPICPEFTAP